MKGKKIIAVLLIAVFMVGLVACGKPAKIEPVTEKEPVIVNSETEQKPENENAQISSLDVGKAVEDVIDSLHDKYDDLHKSITDYESYKNNKDKVSGFYREILSESEKAFKELDDNSIEYFRSIFTEYASDEKALSRAIDDYYDDVCDKVLDDYYDEICSRIMGDMYDDYYSGIISDAYDDLEYKEWSDESSNAYKEWSDASSEIYKMWSDQSSRCYRMWSEASSQYWKENKDVDDVISKIKEARDEQPDDSNDADDTEMVEDTEKEEDTEKIDSEKEDPKKEDPKKEDPKEDLSDGVDPDFKKAMDAYEEFFDEYIDFMNKYKNAKGKDLLAMMGDYSEYLIKYSEAMKEIGEIKEDELSTADAAYYLDVMNRINKKLLETLE